MWLAFYTSLCPPDNFYLHIYQASKLSCFVFLSSSHVPSTEPPSHTKFILTVRDVTQFPHGSLSKPTKSSFMRDKFNQRKAWRSKQSSSHQYLPQFPTCIHPSKILFHIWTHFPLIKMILIQQSPSPPHIAPLGFNHNTWELWDCCQTYSPKPNGICDSTYAKEANCAPRGLTTFVKTPRRNAVKILPPSQ